MVGVVSKRINLSSCFLVAGLITAISLVLLGCWPVKGQCQTQSAVHESVIKKTIDLILADPKFAGSFIGIDIEAPGVTIPIYSINAEKLFVPASNNKLLTGSAALALLGSEFKFKTELYSERIGPDGVIPGDVVIKGAGDPSLSTADLLELAKTLKAKGVTVITGSVVYNDTLFDDVRLGGAWEWDDEPFDYCAQISALNINRNVASVTVTPGDAVGTPAHVSLLPEMRNVFVIDNKAVTGPDGSTPGILITRARATNRIQISGSIPIQFSKGAISEQVTFENPSAVTCAAFCEVLRQVGIRVMSEQASKPAVLDYKVVAEHESQPLKSMLPLMNKPSDNMFAECFFKTIGAYTRHVGTNGALGTGAQAIRAWLVSIGLNPTQFRQVDGSGLSRQNLVSPMSIVRILKHWTAGKTPDSFVNSLPIAGVDGTLKSRMKGTSAQGNCRAKTGSVAYTSSLSGYVTTHNGIDLVFSVMVNSYIGPSSDCRALQDKIVVALSSVDLPVKAKKDTP